MGKLAKTCDRPFHPYQGSCIIATSDAAGGSKQRFQTYLNGREIREIVGLVPDDWLHWNDSPGTPQEIRDVYIRFLIDRIAHSDTFINEARHARQTLI